MQSISPDALGDPDRAATPEGTWYRALIRAESGTLPQGHKKAAGNDGKEHRALQVLPGMTASVEIRTGQRSVLGFLLRPILKASEAFREC